MTSYQMLRSKNVEDFMSRNMSTVCLMSLIRIAIQLPII